MKKPRNFIWIAALVLLPIMGKGQSLELSLEEAMNMACKQNATLKVKQAEFWEARSRARQSLAAFLPQVEASAMMTRTNDPLNVFGQKLKQGVVTQNDFIPADLNNPDGFSNFNTRVDIRQPIFNLDGIIGRGAAEDARDAKKWELERTKEYVLMEVKKQYFAISLAQHKVEVLEGALKTAQANLQLVEDLKEQGYAKEADRLEVSVYVADLEGKLLQSESDLLTAEDYLVVLLNEPKGTSIKTTESLEDVQTLFEEYDQLSDQRADIKAFSLGLDASKKMYKSSTFAFVPRVNAFGALEQNGRQFFGDSKNNYFVGLQLSWTLFNGFKSLGKAQEAKATWLKTQYQFDEYKRQNELELSKAVREAKVYEKRVQLASLAKEQAEESYRMRKDRYEEGLEKTTDLLLAQSLSAQKQLEYLHALYGYKVQLFYLEFQQ
ncbi:TolC family protein [Aureibacter tunicatorum]|uniref:Outer membrane protein TolC n=1 Tax=Aureibacter tunicatorum TaxID=866807 RepID=A0AAE3XSW1_9BACT|nr:TolC family protein [Aureibacter tunicatorum]MDR6240994.1 outer membrane protein TolC [Aureibacter tunicatorum]BDD03773.1 transporter [Aureibacter tunicatorum]